MLDAADALGSDWVFRGQADASWDISSSLERETERLSHNSGKTFTLSSIADFYEAQDLKVISGSDCREIIEAMRALAPFTGCHDMESYMRWTLRAVKGAGGAAPEIEGDTPEARAESFLALLGEMGLVEFLPDQPATRTEGGAGDKGPVPIPAEVFQGIDAVRLEGRTNMLDYPAVIRLAREAGHHGAADWITANVSAYSAGVFRGFVVSKPGKEG